ncbi:hypothetical protein N7537_011611 [Penicillium hordei]|jgi:hypothetical protein|uniref:Uncharacterized protein n=1 Tax=Penicillium hordei TaxID=40994 RepID=A0AAD6DM49_9EURO|nr:uncharacterized protein N7537_011611 [Penicillium hordei]KAJ5588933.1 hypothetical protein N7537_011611 [Penicillium hordei]
MTLASKFRHILTCGRKKDSGPPPISEPRTNTGDGNTEDDYYGTLSEVAAPGPVEPTTEEEEARHESLDKNISRAHSQPQLGNN